MYVPWVWEQNVPSTTVRVRVDVQVWQENILCNPRIEGMWAWEQLSKHFDRSHLSLTVGPIAQAYKVPVSENQGIQIVSDGRW